MRRTFIYLYLFSVAVIILVGWLWFRDLFSLVPKRSDFAGANLAVSRHTRYGGFLEGATLTLGLFLGVAAGYKGTEKRSVLERAGLVIVGWVLTAIAFSLLPRYYFPDDDFAAWLVWLAGSFYPAAGSWLVTVLFCHVVQDKHMAA